MTARLIIFIWFFSFCALPVSAGEEDVAKSILMAKLEEPDAFPLKKSAILELVKVKENFEYYDIDGDTPADLRHKMKVNGTKWNDGKVYAALTTWNIRYNYEITSENGKYHLSSIKTDVDIIFHLPRLAPSAKTPEPLTVTWNSYIGNLTKHETGHRDIAVNIGKEIHQALDSIGNSSSKSELDREAKKVIKAKLQKLQEVQVEYDAATHHGKTQGAVLM